MKSILLLLAATCSAVVSIAQPTLTAASNNPIAGDKFYGHVCDVTGISEGAAGAGVTWDFSGATEWLADTTEYLACTGTAYCDSFPGSTLAVSLGTGSEYQYFTTDAGKFALTGVGLSSGCVYVTDPFNWLSYPMTYGSTVVDTIFAVDSTNFMYHTGIDSFKADAYGTLKLPSGTVANVLRVHVISYFNDSDVSSLPAYVDKFRTEYYRWYATGFHNHLLEISIDTASGAPYVSNVSYFTKPAMLPTIVAEKLPAFSEMNVFPNPAGQDVHIRFNAQTGGQAHVSVTDLIGRDLGEVLNQQVGQGINEITYSVASLPAGSYLLRLQTDGQSVVRKLEVKR